MPFAQILIKLRRVQRARAVGGRGVSLTLSSASANMAASTPFWTAFFLVCFVVFTEADNDLEQPETTARGLETYEIAPPYYGATVKAERYILPVLKWSLSQLQPFLDRATHEAHYYGHHEAYRKKLNTALQQWRDEVSDPYKVNTCQSWEIEHAAITTLLT